jgi:hypothetical protein
MLTYADVCRRGFIQQVCGIRGVPHTHLTGREGGGEGGAQPRGKERACGARDAGAAIDVPVYRQICIRC